MPKITYEQLIAKTKDRNARRQFITAIRTIADAFSVYNNSFSIEDKQIVRGVIDNMDVLNEYDSVDKRSVTDAIDAMSKFCGLLNRDKKNLFYESVAGNKGAFVKQKDLEKAIDFFAEFMGYNYRVKDLKSAEPWVEKKDEKVENKEENIEEINEEIIVEEKEEKKEDYPLYDFSQKIQNEIYNEDSFDERNEGLEDDSEDIIPDDVEENVRTSKIDLKEKPVKNEGKTAKRTIENYQKNFKDNMKVSRFASNYPGDLFATIMAVRLLVNSKRGDASSLNKPVSVDQLVNMKELLKGNETFRDFIEDLKDNPNKLRKAEEAALAGHGGGLDDMFKEYLRTLPAGQLENSELLDRYMPTTLERIEALQDAAKKKMADRQDPIAEVVEIGLLRGNMKAERNKKSSLNKKINLPNEYWSERVNSIVDSNGVDIRLLLTDDIKEKITKGHGGELMDAIVKKAETMQKAKAAENDENVENGENLFFDNEADFLYGHTFKGRLLYDKKEIKYSDNFADDLNYMGEEERDPFTFDKARNNVIKHVAEYVVLSSLVVSKKYNADSNIPWSKVQPAIDEAVKDERLHNLVPKTSKELESFCEHMNQDSNFIEDIITKLNGPKKAEKSNSNPQKKPEVGKAKGK